MFNLQIKNVFLVVIWLFGKTVSNAQIDIAQQLSLPIIEVLDSAKRIISHSEYVFNQSSDRQDLLRVFKNNGITFKSLGPDQLATFTIRGTHGTTHKIHWEGIEINDPLVGSMDMSNFTFARHDMVSFQHHGSGNIGSVINIDHKTLYDTLINIYSSIGLVENGTSQIVTGFAKSNVQLYSSSELKISKAKNDFNYNYNNTKQTRVHNSARSINFKHATDYKLSKHLVGLRIWLNKSDREIPAILGSVGGSAISSNISSRTTISLKRIFSKFDYEVKAAFLNNVLNYTDDRASIAFKGSTNQAISKLKFNYYFLPSWIFKNHFSIKYITAQSTGFSQKLNDIQLSLKPSLSKYLLDDQLIISTFTHINYAYDILQKSTFGLKVNWNILPALSVNSVIERVNQIPSFNDLYWLPGGNVDLKSSHGFGAEIGLNWRIKQVVLNIQLFNKNINDQIIWLPKKGVFSAINIPLTWSRGASINFQFDKILKSPFSFLGHYDFTRSTYQESRIPNDDILGKQLIFIPIHQLISTLSYNYKSWEWTISDSWSGKRFTTSDNSEFLKSYNLLDIIVNREISIKSNFSTQIKLGILNLLGVDYQLQNGWPMPGRQFLFQINFELIH